MEEDINIGLYEIQSFLEEVLNSELKIEPRLGCETPTTDFYKFKLFDAESIFNNIKNKLAKFEPSKQIYLLDLLYDILEKKIKIYESVLNHYLTPKTFNKNIFFERMDMLLKLTELYSTELSINITPNLESKINKSENRLINKLREAIFDNTKNSFDKSEEIYTIKNKKRNALTKIDKKLTNNENINKFIWMSTKRRLEVLFKNLFKSHITQFNLNTLNQHFKVSKEKEVIHNLHEFEKINWVASLRELAFFVDCLVNQNLVSKEGRGYPKLTAAHFTYQGEDTTERRLSSSLHKVREMGYSRPHNYAIIEEIIKTSTGLKKSI